MFQYPITFIKQYADSQLLFKVAVQTKWKLELFIGTIIFINER